MQLNLIEGFDVAELGHNSPETLHLVVEAIKIAKSDIYRYVADPTRFDVEALVKASDGYTGSELEQAVADSLYAGFDEGREIATGDLAAAIQARVPLTETMDAQIDALRTWASRRAKPASSPRTVSVEAKGRAARLDL